MTQQTGDGASAGEWSHAEDRINWARRRAHARQRAADARQRRIAYSLDTLPAARPASGETTTPYAGNGHLSASATLPPPAPGPADDPGGAGAENPLSTLDAEC